MVLDLKMGNAQIGSLSGIYNASTTDAVLQT
jgi:hypothetical protein